MEVLRKVKWVCDPEGMFRPPSLANGEPVRLECERLAAQFRIPILNVCEEVMLAGRIHHFVAICGTEAREYFLSGHCPLDPKKIAKLSRRMPPFILAKMKLLLAGSIDVGSNPNHAFDTDGWSELRRRLPKFCAIMVSFADNCVSTPKKSGLTVIEIARLSPKLQSIQHECDFFDRKLRATRAKGVSTPVKLE